MYDEMFNDIEKHLSDDGKYATKTDKYLFRRRSEHIKRVFAWAKRLADDCDSSAVDKEALLTAALFHDVGYAISDSGANHAENSALIYDKYAVEKGYNHSKSAFISYLIKNHSNKDLLHREDTPVELIILMEADLLDETGALSIVWDCMVEGAQNEQSYDKAYNHINNYSAKLLDWNPMVTKKAKEIWLKKQELVEEFIEQLGYDLGE
ncbi:MAG: HD domain-containing protein [Clostridiales bacterium]|jgi:uncharacterized protein|nr:HD domain-containing protein [Clostridiales bacterium]